MWMLFRYGLVSEPDGSKAPWVQTNRVVAADASVPDQLAVWVGVGVVTWDTVLVYSIRRR